MQNYFQSPQNNNNPEEPRINNIQEDHHHTYVLPGSYPWRQPEEQEPQNISPAYIWGRNRGDDSREIPVISVVDHESHEPLSPHRHTPDYANHYQSEPYLHHEEQGARFHSEPHAHNIGRTNLPDLHLSYPAPQQYAPKMGSTLFRYKTEQIIPLTEFGNLVVEVPVPQKVLSTVTRTGSDFTHLRYSAVVGDPNEFKSEGYSLRQSEAGRETEIFVVVTMYNEDQELFLKTWNSLQKNINYLCQKRNAETWGPDGWQKIVICLVADGRTKINSKTLAVIGLLGIYQEGLIKTKIDDRDVSAHLFEYTTNVSLDMNYNIKKGNTSNSPIQNAKKINSHRWFFNAFGAMLNPKVCILIDVGTKPTEKSFYYLWREFDAHPNVAGACGEIYAENGPFGVKLLNPLVAAQNFEYKMSNILDKPMESVFGFISVLPGAFSAYRYSALQNGADGQGPLEKYFVGEKMHGGANLIMANMYLAEDRILCFELVTKRKEAWVLRYVEHAKAETDVPDAVPEYVSQRRRWLNGSFFATFHAIIHFYQIFRSGHSAKRKSAILFQLLYNTIMMLYNWFAIGSFFLIFTFLTNGVIQSTSTDPFFGNGVGIILTFRQLYCFSIIMIFVASLGNRPQGARAMYTGSFLLFATIMSIFQIHLAIASVIAQSQVVQPDGSVVTSFPTLGKLIAESESFRVLVLSVLSTVGVYIASSVIFLDPWHIITSFVQYLLLVPSFVNILMVYAFCNLHDVSWGTKGDNQPVEVAQVKVQKNASGVQVATVTLPADQYDIDETYSLFFKELGRAPEKVDQKHQSQEDYFKNFRTRVVLLWVFSNILLVAAMITPETAIFFGINLNDSTKFNPFLTFYLWSVAAMGFYRLIGCIAYKVGRIRKQPKQIVPK
ncbi:Chitin synthase, class 1 [Boothiomyces sp. JEL0866]|nr:Chitin synthase, class 1 [Boothiomyces sp. JEL0866]